MRSRTRNPFSTVKTAGLLLPIDLLARIADGDPNLPGLTPESYHLEASDRLNEAAARAWNECSAAWKRFRQELEKLPTSDAGTTLTRERWLLPLFKELGYGRLQPQKAIPIEAKTYPISHAWGGHIPIHLVSCKLELDKRTPGAAGAASRSPYSLVQELLNRSAQHRWGFLSNGRMLYVLRDNVSLTRAANVEFDLVAMFEGDVFADFKLLFLLCHESRVEIPSDGKPEDCWLEKWSKLADDQGTRAREKLRDGVESAIKALGAGFLTTRGNTALRDRLRSGELATQDYYRQLLRMVYRLLLLLVAEEKKDENGRNLLHPPGTPDQARRRYAQYYSVGHLRTLAGKRRGTTHTDLYDSLKLLFLKLRTGYEPLGIPGLGSFLFSPNATPDLDVSPLSNEALLEAIRALCITEDTSGRGGAVRRPVDFANLGSDELGSVYESLLELHPRIDTEEGPFSLGTAAGHERKTTGSYYTPTSLINCLLDSALDPVAKEALNKPTPADAEQALLNLKVCDPACGSGHFLIAAAERLAKHLASLRTGDEEPSTLAIQHAKRDIIGRCIFGVDINPMSVELCQVALWMEALEPGKPFSFLEHHIQCGNSLIGTTPALLAKGIPDEAFTPIEGDDKKVCTAFKKQNKEERRGQGDLYEERYPWERLGNLAAAIAELDTLPDDTADHVRAKEEHYRKLVEEGNYRTSGKFLADLWCAAFVWRKDKTFDYGITERIFRRVEKNPHDVAPWMYDEVRRLAEEYQFFHWHLVFPGIYRAPAKEQGAENEHTGCSGGFNCVLGNPPWERVKLQEQEWFAERRPAIAKAPNAAARKKLIEDLKSEAPIDFADFQNAIRRSAAESHLFHCSGLYPLCGCGDINLYALFAEAMRNRISMTGAVGAIVPTALVTDTTTQDFFRAILDRQEVASIFDFSNDLSLFPAVRGHQQFALITLRGKAIPIPEASFGFYFTDVSDLQLLGRVFSLSPNDVYLVNPNTLTAPVFRTNTDARLMRQLYLAVPILVRESKPPTNPWGIRFSRMFDMSNDSSLFRTREQLENDGFREHSNIFQKGATEYLPLFDAKMAQQYNHRAAQLGHSGHEFRKISKEQSSSQELADPNHVPKPLYYVPCDEMLNRTKGWSHNWLLGFKDITGTTSVRLSAFAVIPRYGVGHPFPVVFGGVTAPLHGILLAVLNSFPIEYVLRQKLQGLHLTYYYLKQLPVPTSAAFNEQCRWSPLQTWIDWFLPRILELTCTAWDLECFARDCGWFGPPFRWDEDRRYFLRCELDAAFFHFYLAGDKDGNWPRTGNEKADDLSHLKAYFQVPRDAVGYVMDSLSIVRRRDEEKYNGDYRTKRVILEFYDAMAEAIRAGQPYQTRLDPPPGPPSEPLPEWDPGQPKPANWPSHIHPPRDCRATPTDEWRLSDLADGATLPRSLKLVLEQQEAGAGVERRWKCKAMAAGDGLPDADTWVLVRHPDLKRGNTAVTVALGKLSYQELTDASTKQKVMVVTLRGPVPPAQLRIPLAEWPSFRPLAVLEPLED